MMLHPLLGNERVKKLNFKEKCFFSNAYDAPPPSGGPDHVDYGAYTGGYGAFGWYTDHPVLLAGH